MSKSWQRACCTQSESYTREVYLSVCTICLVLTNIIPISIVQRRKLKHLKLPLIYRLICYKFLCPVPPNLPWHYFHRSQIFDALKQMQNRFQCGVYTTQYPQCKLFGFLHLRFSDMNYFLTEDSSRGKESNQKH